MDRLTTIENALYALLQSIDGTFQSNGYTFYTVTGQVDIDDDVRATSKNAIVTDINHELRESEDGETNEEWGDGQNIITNTMRYEIHSQIKLRGNEEKRRSEARAKCNEVLADIKYILGNNYQLGGLCNWVKYNDHRKEHTTEGDIINSAKLITEIEVNYSQALKNPDAIACG